MSMFLPPVVTLLAVRLLCQSRVTSCAGAPHHVVPACGKPWPSGGLQRLTMLILSVVPGANTRGRVNRAQTDKHSRWKRGEVLRESGALLRERGQCPQDKRAWTELGQTVWESVWERARETQRATEEDSYSWPKTRFYFDLILPISKLEISIHTFLHRMADSSV